MGGSNSGIKISVGWWGREVIEVDTRQVVDHIGGFLGKGGERKVEGREGGRHKRVLPKLTKSLIQYLHLILHLFTCLEILYQFPLNYNKLPHFPRFLCYIISSRSLGMSFSSASQVSCILAGETFALGFLIYLFNWILLGQHNIAWLC